MTIAKRARLAVVAASALATLGACSGDSWFGGDSTPPLQGKRISVLEHERRLEPAAGTNATIRLPQPEPNEDWPQAGGYSHHAMQHLVVGDRPEEVWRADAGEGSGSRNRLLGEPVVGAGRVYVVDADAQVSAFDAASGDRLWEVDVVPDHESGNSILGGGVAYADGRVYVTTGFAQVVALDAASGAEVWRTRVTSPVRAAPTLNGGRVFVVTLDNKGIALAASDGRILWTHAGVEETAALLGGAAPAADNGVVVMAYSSGELVTLREDTGAPLWSDAILAARRTDATANLADIRARPVIDNGRLFVVGHSGLLVGIDMRTGDRAWEIELAGLQQPWVAGGVLYALSIENELVAVDAANGRLLWVTQLATWEDPEDRTGRIEWAGPTLASDRLIVTGSHGVALSVSPYSGAVLGQVELPTGISLAPAVADGTLYFLTDDADLIAFR
ncbi:PQQ-binding-like beta-propeller repeat protein [Novispirillum sp. DQ9]|uniref:outer membrane protein assembly factor BamB family protein n=1 Tax=Novispirillum sp. DQ9 TaxID=3398612 RepID=UPI003C7BDF18